MSSSNNNITTTIISALVQNTYSTPIDYEIPQYPSYIAIGCVVFFTLFIIIARLAIRVDGQQSDLILFNKSPQKHLLLLVSKQLYNTTAAQNNIASAIANGLMEPPPNYDSAKTPTSANGSTKTNGFSHNAFNDVSTKTSTTTINSINKFEPLDTIEPLNKACGKRQKW
jgi:hypothetical protein